MSTDTPTTATQGGIRLTPAQALIASDVHRFRVVCCGRRFGKTTLAVEEIKACAVNRQSRIAYIAPTFQQARDIAWTSLKKDCENAAIKINESRLEILMPNNLGGESLIMLRGWESIETLRGQSFDLIVLDEVSSMRNFESQWKEVVRPTLSDRRGEVLFISTPKGFNHFYTLYNRQETDNDYKSFRFTSYDNPNIPKDEIDKARTEVGDNRFEQEFMANFHKTEGLVYKDFDRSRHVVDAQSEYATTTEWRELIVGVDFGFTNPTAILSIRRDSADIYFVEAESYKRGSSDAETADYVAALKPNRCYPDPEAPSSIEELKKRGVNVRTVVKGKGSVRNGIEKVRELLRADKLKISSACENLIWEMETYAYGDKKDAHNEEENPIKENDHAADALRYVIMMVGGTTGGSSGAPNAHYSSTPQYGRNVINRANFMR